MEKSGWDLAREAAEREACQKHFEEMVEIGKKAEIQVALKLRSLGFTVTDISQEVSSGTWSPFDLLAVRYGIPYVIDVKRRSCAYTNCWFKASDIEHWDKYSTNAEKIVVFNMSGAKWEYRYISVSALKRYMFNRPKRKSTIWFISYLKCADLELIHYYTYLEYIYTHNC